MTIERKYGEPTRPIHRISDEQIAKANEKAAVLRTLKAENELLKNMLADANKMLVGSQLRK